MVAPHTTQEDDETLFRTTNYEVLGRLGQGAMGTVFFVRHRETQGRCVAKVIHKHLVPDQKARDRFRLEAQSLGRLNHPHIVSARATGTTSDGRPFVVLEYLPGKTLSQVLRKESISAFTALEYGRQLLLALAAAHYVGVVHRDLNPGNIILAEQPDGSRLVKVLDFGLAKVLPQAPSGSPSPLIAPTTVGTIVGTPRYISPEAAAGEGADERSDVYAAALILYKMLTGRDAFIQNGTEPLLRAQENEAPAPPSRWTSDFISKRLDEVILQALAKNPANRFQGARQFMDALLSCKEGLEKGASPMKFRTTTRLALVFFGMVTLGVAAAYGLRVFVF